jgi:phosphate transport system protein
MLEGSLAALKSLDVEAAKQVRRTDDQVDLEEVAIEQEAYELLALHHPYGRDFRTVAFCLRVNADMERVADHASSIAKVVTRLAELPGTRQLRLPTALVELGDRVPQICHALLRAVLDEDIDAAQRIVTSDQVIDQLDRRLFEEVQELVKSLGRSDDAITIGLLVYRASRELERVGDLMAAVAEDVVYLGTGQIIRHAKRRGLTRPDAPKA